MPTGFLYRRKDRHNAYYCTISTGRKVNGKYEKHVHKIGLVPYEDAQAAFAKILYKYNREANGETNNRCLMSVIYDAYAAHLDTRQSNAKTKHDDKEQARKCIEALKGFGVYDAEGINPQVVDKIIATWRQERSTNTINKRLAQLKAMLKHAVKSKLIRDNPAEGIDFIKQTKTRERRNLTPAEAKALIEASKFPLCLVWETYLLTGMRENELANLTAQDVNLEAMTITVKKSKTKAGERTIPIGANLAAKLKALRPSGNHVFGNGKHKYRGDWLGKQFKRAMYKALCLLAGKKTSDLSYRQLTKEGDPEVLEELKKLDVHSLRYTFCSELVKQGTDIKTVQKLMGHASPEVTLKIYAQFSNDNAKQAIEKLNFL